MARRSWKTCAAAWFVLALLGRGSTNIAAESAAPATVGIDFSSAGYGGGGVGLPVVAAKYVITPSGSDDTRAIQAGIDALAKLRLGPDGFRGALLLRGGMFRIGGQLKIAESGIVLRGDGATLLATGNSRRTLIDVRGRTAGRALGPVRKVMDEVVGVGATGFTLDSIDGIAVGARVVVRRPSTREWIQVIGANNYPVQGQYRESRLDWIPGSRDIEWERTVVAVDAATRRITVDAPITTALEGKFGGGTVQTLDWPDRLRKVGIENLICESEVNAANPLDEEHAWMCLAIDNAEDVWVRRVTARRFVSSCVWVANRARAVTIEDCASADPVSEIGGWRRVSFYVGGQQVLVQRCTAEDGGRDFVVGHCSAGPNVFLDCKAVRANADSGPFESWASGALYDNVSIAGAALSFANIGARTQGAAWTAANCVLWNCAAAGRIKVENPPGAPNHVVVDPATPSIYRAQLVQRKGPGGLSVLAPRTTTEVNRIDRETPLPTKAPSPSAEVKRPVKPLTLVNGYFVVEGRAIFGGAQNSALWKGQIIPGREREVGTSPTRWAPGRFGRGLTEDLDALTDSMIAQQTPFYYAFPGLWYDRRRDEHSIARREDGEVWAPFFEAPWARSGQGKAWDGLSKYDLTKFNPWYFARLRELAGDCAAKGLVFVCQAYDNHNVEEAAAHWAEYAWRQANCLQDVGFPEPPRWENAGQNRHHIADEFYDVNHPGRRALHVAYINHILDVLGEQPNFVLTLGYQFAGPLPFQQFFIDAVAAWEKAHGHHIRLQLQTSKAVTDAILADPVRAGHVDIIDTRYWQYLPDGKLFAPDGLGKLAFREIRTNTFGRDAIMGTKAEFVYKQVREYRDRFPDKAVVAGQGGFGPIPVLMAGGASPVNAESAAFFAGSARDDAAALKFIAERFADVLPQMKPVDGFVVDAWCLADANRANGLIYSEKSGTIELVEPMIAREVEWFNVRTGETRHRATDGQKTIQKPTADAWLLLWRRSN